MVKNIAYFLICTIAVSLVFLSGCWPKNDIPPTFTGKFPDSICKNGYRVYSLDTLVEDPDPEHPDSLMRWSISSGPLLTIRLIHSTAGDSVKIEPLRNQIGTDWVDFIVTDPSGLSASKTCQVHIIDPDTFFIFNIRDTQIGLNDTIKYVKHNCIEYSLISNKDSLRWTVNTDNRFLRCDTTTNRSNIYLIAKDTTITTGVYFEIYDPENHVQFNRSILVEIQ